MRNMCSVGRAFFTLVSGVYSLALVSAYLRRRVPYVQPTALCLRRQLFRVRTACPVYLVLDDRSTAIKVSNHSLHRLRHVYGAHRLVSLVCHSSKLRSPVRRMLCRRPADAYLL